VTGAIAALVSNGVIGGGSVGSVAPAAISWNDIYGEDSGSTQTALITGITAPIQLAASKTGGAELAYILNGIYVAYRGAFAVYPNDALGWSTISTSTADQSGVVTVTNVTSGTTLDTFNYTIYSSRGPRL
jgi:hypothetical protein